MERQNIIGDFAKLGELFFDLSAEREWRGFESGVTAEEYEELNYLIKREKSHNGWFTEANVRKALGGLATMLTEQKLREFCSNYSYASEPKAVALIMAGNIPMVGFHDFMCVLLSGNKALCKLSSDDKNLLPVFARILRSFEPGLNERIEFVAGKMPAMDAVIATGSDNSLLYFEQYFGKYPHIFRKNRTSVAVLKAEESDEKLQKLGEDIFAYFGLGCRNVTFLLIHQDFEINRFFENIVQHGDIINHHKYANNYDYNRVVYLLNEEKLLDNNFVILRESESLFSPLSVIQFRRYSNEQEVKDFISANEREIQVVVGENHTPFGQAQKPEITDFADKVDTMQFLNSLS